MSDKQQVLAYYFPQYHSIPENDIVFGENFNDWDLFRKYKQGDISSCKKPLDHPDGLGFYDPRETEIRKKQGELAMEYGVDGFIYYHYWLENGPVMDKVLLEVLNDNEPNISFCICFTNQFWKHNYKPTNGEFKSFHPDGSTFRQLYDKPKEHALFLSKIFNHHNYIKIDNRPILFVYMFDTEVMSYLEEITNELNKYGISKLYIITCTSRGCLSKFKEPNNNLYKPDAYSPFIAHHKLTYEPILPSSISSLPKVYSGLMGWNSLPRHPGFKTIIDYKPADIIKQTIADLLLMNSDKTSPQIYTLFAWNEWAEGAIIEPCTIYGDSLGKAIKKARDIVKAIENLVIEYGFNDVFINVTQKVFSKCIEFIKDKWTLRIGTNDCHRAKLLGDPLPGICKVIRIKINGITLVYNHTSEVMLLLE
jgi:hypothetical protein